MGSKSMIEWGVETLEESSEGLVELNRKYYIPRD